MATDPRPRFPIEVIILIISTTAALCITLMLVGPDVLSQILRPTPTEPPPTTIPTSKYQPEVIPAPTYAYTPSPVWTPTVLPTDTPAPTPTITSTPVKGVLPDLIVTGISDPKCTPDHIGTTTGVYVKFTIFVRNIGHASTYSFGPFELGVSLILGQTYYGLDEWASRFNGVVGNLNLRITNLAPNQDVAVAVELDLKGNATFGIQAVANSGANPIPETDTTNNTLVKYFSSIYCY